MTPMPETITIRIVTAPASLKDGFYLDSPYVDQFWSPVIGPSCVMLLKAFDRLDNQGCRTSSVRLKDLAMEIGVGAKRGRDSAIWRSLERLAKFNLVGLSGDGLVLEVRDRVPRLGGARQWPEHVRAAHVDLMLSEVAA